MYRRAALVAASTYREGMSRDERAAAQRQPDLPGAGGSSGSERSGARELDEGPAARWAVLLAAVAVLPAPVVLLELLRSLPERGWEQAIVPLLLIVSWLAGAYSLTRVLQLAVHALTRPAPPRRREPSFSLTQAHTLHSIWLIGLGASIAFMGLLGLWSWADGRTSGLEPGWPLILIGAVLAALSAGASRLMTRTWRDSESR